MDSGSYWHGYLMARHHVSLILGCCVTAFALISALTGVSIEKYRGIIYRSDDPKRFWQSIAIYFLLGLICLGLYFYTAN
jgi:hypothetical protein